MTEKQPDMHDVAIIGAGPAGLAAAAQLVKAGASVAVFDEQMRPGGQIMRQPPKGFKVKGWLKGALYSNLIALLQEMEDHPRIFWHMPVSVTGIEPLSDAGAETGDETGFAVFVHGATGGSGHGLVKARKVLLSSGCYERPLVFPGATTPGVMGAGAIQTFLKSQQIIAGNTFVFAGVHPLQLIVAEQTLDAGGKVEAIAFAQSASDALAVLTRPDVLFHNVRAFATAARSLARLKRAGVPILFNHAVKSVAGSDEMTGVTLQTVTKEGRPDSTKPEIHIAADRLGLCYGFQVSSELARQAGADSLWSAHRGGWLIRHDRWMESSIKGLYVAGELTGMAGADASRHEGTLAGLGIGRSLGLIDGHDAQKPARQARKALHRLNRFADLLSRLSRLPDHLAMSLMTDDSLLCRCEAITCGTVKQALRDHPHLMGADAVKLFTRVGMGLCQGRLCHANLAALIAGQRGCNAGDAGPFHARWPIKPIPIADLVNPPSGE